MVTGHLQTKDSGTAQKLWVIVTEAEWVQTLEEQLPSRPAAATKPKETGAAYLSVGAAATLVALSLF
jgi:hypothetical protein